MAGVKWVVAEVVGLRNETPTARTLLLRIPRWTGHLAGQHIDVRLTAADGYQAARSYSLSSSGDDEFAAISVERMPDGEVSPYLVDDVAVGTRLEVLGPLGGWFVWRPTQAEPIRMIGGGSGIAPLVSILRTHLHSGSEAPVQLLYSVRTPDFVYFKDELAELTAAARADVSIWYTRAAPEGWQGPVGRLSAHDVQEWATRTPPSALPASSYICGPTRFVELMADALVSGGADPLTVRTERFGGD